VRSLIENRVPEGKMQREKIAKKARLQGAAKKGAARI